MVWIVRISRLLTVDRAGTHEQLHPSRVGVGPGRAGVGRSEAAEALTTFCNSETTAGELSTSLHPTQSINFPVPLERSLIYSMKRFSQKPK